MSIVSFERNRIRQQEIEVQALIALTKYGSQPQKFKALGKLEKIAHPEDLAKQIEQMRLSEMAANI
jgi:hypothetical protein